MTQNTHIIKQLLPYTEHRLDAAARTNVDAHLAVCRTCRTELHTTEMLVSSLQAMPHGLQHLPGRPATRWAQIQARLPQAQLPQPGWQPLPTPSMTPALGTPAMGALSSSALSLGISGPLNNWRSMMVMLLLLLVMLLSLSLAGGVSDLQLPLPNIAAPVSALAGTVAAVDPATSVEMIAADTVTDALDSTATLVTFGTPTPAPAATAVTR